MCAKIASSLAVLVVCASSPTQSQTTSLASADASGAAANGSCYLNLVPPFYPQHGSLSTDGRYVAFECLGTNLVDADTNGYEDVFVRDRQNGTIELVSLSTSGEHGIYGSRAASISADGRFVAFESDSPNLVAGDANDANDVFVRDRWLGTTELVSVDGNGVQGNGASFRPSISADGRFVAFMSKASNLVFSDTNGSSDIFVRDRQARTTERVSVSSAGGEGDQDSDDPSICDDGRFVAFHTYASNLVPNESPNGTNVLVRDRQNGTTLLVSVGLGGVPADQGSLYPAISGDGRFVAFMSFADNLVPGDLNGYPDIFVRDLVNDTTEIASLAWNGLQANGGSFAQPAISTDGRFVAWDVSANNLVPPRGFGSGHDVYVRDRQLATTERVSVNAGGAPGNHVCVLPNISGDGRFVAFTSASNNLVPLAVPVGIAQIYVRDRDVAIVAFCFGDGTGAACPCANFGLPGHGCRNSTQVRGAELTSTGVSSIAADSLVLQSAFEVHNSTSVFLQGTQSIAPTFFGDGLRCTGGVLKRLYVVSASPTGIATAPTGSALSISARSAQLGDVIPPGASRDYQTYYRDSDLSFCPSPTGDSWNVSNGLTVVWNY